MSGLLYLFALIGIGMVIFWYVKNERFQDTEGRGGVFGTKNDD